MVKHKKKLIRNILVTAFIVFGLAFLISRIDSPTERAIKLLQINFAEYTDKEWPEGATLISIGDTRDPGSFRGGGAYHLIFQTDSETVAKWLKESPPWGTKNWKQGPVDDEIEYNFNNFFRGSWHNPDFNVASLQSKPLPNHKIAESGNLLRLDKPLSELQYPQYKEHNNMAELQDSNIIYSVKLGTVLAEGMLFAIDTKKNIVFVSLWDIVR